MNFRPGLYVLLPVFIGLLLQPYHSANVLFSGSTIPPRLLLLTAHPDDETFFFGPTLTSLIPPPVITTASASTGNKIHSNFPQVYSLCFSVGNADGLGYVRRNELEDSLDVLGVAKDHRWILDEHEFQDNITALWDASLIAATVYKYVTNYNISIILTFDSFGVSGHPNHFSLYHGVSHLLTTSPAGTEHHLAAFSLNSKPVVTKYTGILAAMLIKFWTLRCIVRKIAALGPPCSASFCRRDQRILPNCQCTMRHRSQRVWFRWLYMLSPSTCG
ncbi:putative deacetylase LmbE-like domain-containing protein [Multifurca ochricompacta]|uniref:N-acetylglucosaminylphosphatidylinositol deacetylase n=1 Tax=Multifurca ochricompacta TaxID=376703 RepID=A0AAD4QNU7_9AGAM|nr:putative deacetylase LmbE-like domain-containing protein [Multifurca ochricompacta]